MARAANAGPPPQGRAATNIDRFRCCACGACCRGWSVELDEPSRNVIQLALDRLPHPDYGSTIPAVTLKGRTYLQMRDGACVYLQADNRCFLHANFGEDSKPAVCRHYPRRYAAAPEHIFVSLSPSCHSAAMLMLSDPAAEMIATAVAATALSRPDPFRLAHGFPLDSSSAFSSEEIVRKVLDRNDISPPERLLVAIRLVDHVAEAGRGPGRPDIMRELSAAADAADSTRPEYDPPQASAQYRVLKSLVAHRCNLARHIGQLPALRELLGLFEEAYALENTSAKPPGSIRVSRALALRWTAARPRLDDKLTAYFKHQIFSRTYTQTFGLADGMRIVAFLYFLSRCYAAALAVRDDSVVHDSHLETAVTAVEREFAHSSIILDFWRNVLEIPGARNGRFAELLIL